MYCPRCGAPRNPNSNFCPNCGASLAPIQPRPVNRAVTAPLAPAKKGRKKTLLVGLIAIIMVAATAGAALSDGNNKTATNEENGDERNEDQVATVDNGGNQTNDQTQDETTMVDDSNDNITDLNKSDEKNSIKIVQIESNPAGIDAGNEWLKISNFGNSSVDLKGWYITTSHGRQELDGLSGTIEPYQTMTIKFSKQFLDNEDESVTLYDSKGNAVDQTPSITDKKNDSWTWIRPVV